MKKILGVLAGISIAAFILLNTKEKEREPSFYERFEKALNAQGIEVQKARQMAASLVGALDGKKFSTLAGDIEIYRFEDGAHVLRKAKAIGKFSVNGSTFYNVVVNGPYMLYVSSLPENIIDTFLSIPTTTVIE